MPGLVKNTALYTIGNILPKAASFILLPIYVKYLTPADYGIINSLQVLNSILTVLFTFSLGSSVYRLYFDYKEEKDKKIFTGTMNIGILILATVSLIIIFFFQDLFSNIFKSISFWPFIAISVFTGYLSVFESVPKAMLQIKGKALLFIVISILQFILTNTLIIWLVIVNGQGVLGYIKAMMYSSLIIAPLFLLLSFNGSVLVFKLNIFREALKYSIPLIPGVISAWVLNLSDRIFIEHYNSMKDVGIYSLGYNIAGLILIFSMSFKNAYDPYFYKTVNTMNKDQAVGILYRTNTIYHLIIIFMCFFIAFFSREVLILLFDSRYHEAYKIIPIICLAYVFSQIAGLFNLSFYQLKKTSVLMWIVVLGAISNITLNFYLISHFGIYGAAWSTVFSFFLILIIEYYLSKKYYFVPINFAILFPLAGSIIMVLITDYFFRVHNVYNSFLIKFAFLIVFFIIIFFKYRSKLKIIFSTYYLNR